MSQIWIGVILLSIFITHAASAGEELSCNQALRYAQASCAEKSSPSSQVLLECSKARTTCMTVCKQKAEVIDDVVLEDVYTDYMMTCKHGEVARNHRLISQRARASSL